MQFPDTEKLLHNIDKSNIEPVFHSDLIRLNPPQYGCLKNGTLPTFRQFHGAQKTLKNNDSETKNNYLGTTTYLGNNDQNVQDTREKTGGDSRRSFSSFPERSEGQTEINPQEIDRPTLYYPCNKKILHRKFTVGKSNKNRKVSVLVSNKTIRHDTITKNSLLKQTSIPEIKRFLIKRGLIKVGSTAPNEVLRQMYETASLMCGDVKNHNSEILLYNYFNDVKQ
jgi:hypothetical protein